MHRPSCQSCPSRTFGLQSPAELDPDLLDIAVPLVDVEVQPWKPPCDAFVREPIVRLVNRGRQGQLRSGLRIKRPLGDLKVSEPIRTDHRHIQAQYLERTLLRYNYRQDE